jgi:Flp pilus assembly pilin Flp
VGSIIVLYRRVVGVMTQQRGQTMAEYAVILALIAVVVAAALTVLSGNIGTTLGNVGQSL